MPVEHIDLMTQDKDLGVLCPGPIGRMGPEPATRSNKRWAAARALPVPEYAGLAPLISSPGHPSFPQMALLRWPIADGRETGSVNTRSTASLFAGFRFRPEVISLAVRWYLRDGLSYRDAEELLAERGITVDHVTIYRWVTAVHPGVHRGQPGRAATHPAIVGSPARRT